MNINYYVRRKFVKLAAWSVIYSKIPKISVIHLGEGGGGGEGRERIREQEREIPSLLSGYGIKRMLSYFSYLTLLCTMFGR